MKGSILFFLLAVSLQCMAQKTFHVSKDDDGGLIYNGPCTFNDLDKEPSFTWLKSDERAYKPDEHAQLYLDAYLRDYSLIVFMGTWCDDSHYLIPKLEKVLHLANYPMSRLTMYGVDRAKETFGSENNKYNISFVPTIILYRNGIEAGRITETVNKSIEEDLAAIIARDSGKAIPR